MRYEIPENYHQKQRSDEEAAEEAQLTQTPCRSPCRSRETPMLHTLGTYLHLPRIW